MYTLRDWDVSKYTIQCHCEEHEHCIKDTVIHVPVLISMYGPKVQ